MSTLAVVVLSGGLDSATALGMAMNGGADEVYAITFEYGQKHAQEVNAATALCEHYGVTQAIIPLPESLFRGGVLTTDEEVPDMRYSDLPSGTMSPTYVPFRNGNLLSMATAYADSLLRTELQYEPGEGGEGTGEVVTVTPRHPRWDDSLVWAGMHAEDAAGFAYADCTPEFLGAMTAAIWIGTYGRVRLHVPFQAVEKWEIVAEGMRLDVPYHLTLSCYKGTVPACGTCATCNSRLDAFERAGYSDPIPYEVNR